MKDTLRHIVQCLSCCAALCLAGASFAQPANWPVKPLRVVVPYAPGGPPDVVIRLLSPKLSELLGQPIVVENRTGAGGNIGTVAVAKSPPDGYTMLVTSSGFVVNISFPDAGYTERDFAAVTVVAAQPNVIVVHPSVPANTLAEFFAYAKDQKLAFSSPGSGTTPHLTGENVFNIVGKLGLPAAHFRGAGPAAAAVVSGQPPVGSLAMTAPMPFIKSGRLRALAVSSAQRLATLPQVPTLAESGYPNIVDYTWVGIFMPAGTPAPIVQKLYEAVQRVLQNPEVKERLAALAFDLLAEPPARTTEYVREEIGKWGAVVRETGAKLD
jgi:tripartite-type tricarboxylate transporter receptor subunit TctC